MLSCTVGTCPQTFRCSLDLSLLCWMKKWSPCPEELVQVSFRLHISWFRVRFNHFLPLMHLHSVILYSDLEIIGFIEIADISSPPVISRHLVLPIAVNKGKFWSFWMKKWFIIITFTGRSTETACLGFIVFCGTNLQRLYPDFLLSWFSAAKWESSVRG